ncbi:MAG TPA: type 4a pilus biogenesis protein PilO [Fimbriimonadaceae bacterium]|nr:type 4a pilus biogenesis protein PilO [Fimbriimonadaceae bacterium]HRJ95771.1 type 4a pilus biogenesis protein PilO [Fimbriimonadaceae bacterium]
MKGGPNPTVFAIMAIASLVVGSGAIYWQYSQLSERLDSVTKLKKALRDENQTRQEVAESQLKVDESRQRLVHLEQGVPELAYIPTLLTELEAIGKENGLEVLGVRPVIKQAEAKKPNDSGQAPKKKAYEELNIEVKGRGNYDSVAAFLQALRTFPKIVAVRTVTLTPKYLDTGQGADSPTLDATVEIRAFLFPQAETQQVASADRKTMDRRNVADQLVEPEKK